MSVKLRKGGFVMDNPGFQFDHICNQLKPKLLGTFMRDFFFTRSFKVGIPPRSEPYLLVAAHINGPVRREVVFFPACPQLC